MLNLLLLSAGLALLLAGGELLVRGASALAQNLGIHPLIIGLTIVAFGTSAPELSVNLLAAFKGNTEISFGNVIGSNIANIGLILGISALIRPLAVQSIIIIREIPMMILASLLALITGLDTLLKTSPDVIDRSDGIVCLLIFGVFLFYTIGDVMKTRKTDSLLNQVEEGGMKVSPLKTVINLGFFVAGLVLLVGGGKVAVDSAVVLAESMGIQSVIIGLTIVAVGTSLPELVTSVLATIKGQTDIAIGNVVGSNIFNLLFINGICASIKPIPVPNQGGLQDLLMMILLSTLLLPLCVTHKRMLVRWEGFLFLALYFGYAFWRVF